MTADAIRGSIMVAIKGHFDGKVFVPYDVIHADFDLRAVA